MNKPGKRKKGSLQEIEQGEITHASNKKVPYRIVHGWDLMASLECDTLWKQDWIALFKHIQQAEPDKTKQDEILASMSTEDTGVIEFDHFADVISAKVAARSNLNFRWGGRYTVSRFAISSAWVFLTWLYVPRMSLPPSWWPCQW